LISSRRRPPTMTNVANNGWQAQARLPADDRLTPAPIRR
jgi:hypothetical protein